MTIIPIKEEIMDKEILLAVDGSERSTQAVCILGDLLKEQSDCKVLLFYSAEEPNKLYPGELALMNEPSRFADNTLGKLADNVLQTSRKALLGSGFPEDRIELRFKSNGLEAADDILKEAEARKIQTIACGRRGRSRMESLLLGSVSSKVAQYGRNRTVWIVDTPVHQTRKVLVAMEGVPDSRALTYYTSEWIAPIPDLQFTILHIMPSLPPTLWDDGHILEPEERKRREYSIEKWRFEWSRHVDKFLSETRDALIGQGALPQNVRLEVRQVQEGIARDLLKQTAGNQYQMVIIGKRSFYERKLFLVGSHANKILQNIKGVILCLVDS
jgi:nucleotide-binding universal stress UspA family protein